MMQGLFSRIATRSACLMGHPMAFLGATATCIVWALTGPLFHYSDTWQLVINTGTTVLTFLAVFLIQNSQNRDGAAIQAKLDEIVRAIETARPEFIGLETKTDEEIAKLKTELQETVAAAAVAVEAEARPSRRKRASQSHQGLKHAPLSGSVGNSGVGPRPVP